MLGPSDFAFLWDDCPRCFYRKVARKEGRPRSPVPSVFGKIDRAMKDFYLGRRTDDLVSKMPAGVFAGGSRWVKSAPLRPPSCTATCTVRGFIDVLVDCDDGSTGIVDFKTSVPKAEHLATYSRQLHAYALALEHPSRGPGTEVSSLGLLCYLPETFEASDGEAALSGPLQWIEVPRDDLAFAEFLGEVVVALDQPDPPDPAVACQWCQLRGNHGVAA